MSFIANASFILEDMLGGTDSDDDDVHPLQVPSPLRNRNSADDKKKITNRSRESIEEELIDTYNNEHIKRAGILAEEQYEREEFWQCPICIENPPVSRWSRLHETFRQKGHQSLKTHMILHRFESLRRQLVCDAIKTEERTMRRKCDEEMELQFHLLLHYDSVFRHLRIHKGFVQHCRADFAERVAQGWEEQSEILSKEWRELVDVMIAQESTFRMYHEEEEERKRIGMANEFTAVFDYTFKGSPFQEVPFVVIFGEMTRMFSSSPPSSPMTNRSSNDRSPLKPHSTSAAEDGPSFRDSFILSTEDYWKKPPTSAISSSRNARGKRHRANSIFFAEDELVMMTLRQHFDRRFARICMGTQQQHTAYAEDARECDTEMGRSAREQMLPRGINQFNIDQLLYDVDMEDESSFLPVVRQVPDADERSPTTTGKQHEHHHRHRLSRGATDAVNTLLLMSGRSGDGPSFGSGGGGDAGESAFFTLEELNDEEEELRRLEMHELHELRMALQKKAKVLEAAEAYARDVITSTESERRQRALLSVSSFFGIDIQHFSGARIETSGSSASTTTAGDGGSDHRIYHPHHLPRLTIKVRQFFQSEVAQRQNIQDVEDLSWQRIERRRSSLTAAMMMMMMAGSKKISTRTAPSHQQQQHVNIDCSVCETDHETSAAGVTESPPTADELSAEFLLRTFPNGFAKAERQYTHIVNLLQSRRTNLAHRLTALHLGDEDAAATYFEQKTGNPLHPKLKKDSSSRSGGVSYSSIMKSPRRSSNAFLAASARRRSSAVSHLSSGAATAVTGGGAAAATDPDRHNYHHHHADEEIDARKTTPPPPPSSQKKNQKPTTPTPPPARPAVADSSTAGHQHAVPALPFSRARRFSYQ